MGEGSRYGSKTDEFERDGPPPRQSKLRVRIKNPEQIPQRKTTKKRTTGVMYEANEGGMPHREFIKRMVLDDETLQPRDMAPLIWKAGYSASIVMISNIRSEFRDSLRLLKKLGWRKPKP